MKKILLFIALFGSLLSISYGQTVTIPAANTNTGSVNDPFGAYYGYERTALIYTAAQIGTTGTITNVRFYVNSVSTPSEAKDVRVYMKMRTNLFTATSTYATEISGANLVYGPVTISGASFAAGWFDIALTNSFNYTGNNLEIIIETNYGGYGNEGSTGKQFRYSRVGSPASNQYYQTWNQDSSAPTTNGSLNTNRPNVQLVFASACPSPYTLTASAITSSSATVSWTAASPAPSNGY